ncbi:cytochrome c [Chryseobacterium shandongense]|mgnify:CR=1 FL=1|uniref:Cytochrome c n=1 Tax=Chryseobacterium shandongense TaxID=1493872 RepID=A0A3G6MSV2_9FLAO|nr:MULTISPECIES: c-type cytochrome [Chryseobacterium]AZA55839.1 cytochrome c [Chryseobacterium shandongense]AZA87766.1 cytochrome c [Chryseobacterium shandongense]AZA96327.1 cytochrome c [Chryseobacterium shandongense]
MLKMKKNVLKITAVLGLTTVLLNSCGPKENTPLVYFPDMYFPVAYDPLMKAQDAYSDHENEIPAFVKNNGATGLSPVEGSVAQNKDGIFEEGLLPKNVDEYNAGYDASKSMTASPLNPANSAKDLERGKQLFEKTCAACHGVGGDGQGPIVQSGAFSGVPNYADREITVGSVHYVITNGRNAMGSYAGQLNAGDRWRVAMYVMNAFKKGAAAPAAATPAAGTATTASATAAAPATTETKTTETKK